MRKFGRLFLSVKILMFLILICSGTMLTGCALTQKPKVIEVFLLDPVIPIPASPTRLLKGTRIVVDEIESSSLLKNNSIIFGRDALTRSKYQYSEWETPVPIKLQKLLANALQASNQFSTVVRNEVIGLPAWKLKLEITDFYHDAQNNPGDVVIRINASLINPKGTSIARPALFEARRPAFTFNAHGAVVSLNEATAQLIPQITAWTISEIREFRRTGPSKR